MEWFTKAFIRSSLLWFAAGTALGVGMAMHPGWVIFRPAHAHMNVAGFLSMLLFGVGYQLLPRLFGHPLHSGRLAVVHLISANLGLTGLVLGFMVAPYDALIGRWLTSIGGSIYALGVILWVFNLWRTFDAADARQRTRMQSPHGPLPTVDE